MMKHRLALVLLAASFLAVSCGGSDTPAPASAVEAGTGTGSVPLYHSATEVLTLPQLRVADNIATDVKLRLKKDGSWALLSAGPVRLATAADAPGAVLAEPGGNADLAGAQTDTTLTVARLHVGSRVFGNVAVRLIGKTWAFVSSPQEVKTLHQEDFKSNTVIRADESHHVVLKSSPDTGVQNVPMQLSSRNYKFCMDAQAEGADSTTLLDAAGKPVFTLKAGEPCVTVKAREGAYTLQHRYGGTGSARTVFMRNQANTTTTTATQLAAKAPALSGLPKAQRALAASATAANDSVPVIDEYWSVGRVGDTWNFLGVVGRSSTNFPTVGPAFCADPPTFGFQNLWLSNAFMAVVKDGFGAQQLGVPLACTSDPVANNIGVVTSYITDVNDTGDWKIHSAFEVPNLSPGIKYDWGSSPDGRQFPGYLNNSAAWVAQPLLISGQNASQFELTSNGHRVIQVPPYDDSFGQNYQLATVDALDDPAYFPSVQLRAVFRYFPKGLPASMTLGVGQVALFTGADCTGRAVISEQTNIPYFTGGDITQTNSFGAPLYEPTYLPGLATLGKSFQLGLQTSMTAYTAQNYQGEAQQFDQLDCKNSSVGSSGQPMASLSVAVDTVTMVISTNSCEFCNLAGVDFSGLNLSNVKLSNANLNSAILSNIDLSGADLRNASLQGAQLTSSNLDGANLCSAQLNGSPGVSQAATLTGAHLRNTNLALANLDGVRLSSVSFYSSDGQGTCQQTSCGSYVASTCASAYGASINNASFDSAYLSNVDMSNVTGAGVNFNNAALFGVLFGQANLSHNTVSAVNSSFINAYLQGADLSRAKLQFADFTGATFDAASNCMQANLNPAYSNFPGGMVLSSASNPTCVPRKSPVVAAAVCVESSFAVSPAYPQTDCTNICADGRAAGGVVPTNGTCQNTATCSAASWTTPPNSAGNSAMPTSSCLSDTPLCVSKDGFTSGADPCW